MTEDRVSGMRLRRANSTSRAEDIVTEDAKIRRAQPDKPSVDIEINRKLALTYFLVQYTPATRLDIFLDFWVPELRRYDELVLPSPSDGRRQTLP